MIVGRYAILPSFASGGMATLHLGRAQAESGPSVVAIKRLHPHLRREEAFALALLDEANLARRIEHPNVVRVLDVVQTEEELLLVMEYVSGLSVFELVRKSPPVEPGAALAIVIAVLRGLDAAHGARDLNGRPLHLVHRDVSPQNILVDTQGRVRITDFGVAKAAGRLRSTRDGKIRGKLAYMSPEQAADEPIDARADVYAAAVVLWELLTGSPLFDAESDAALFGKVLRGTTRRLVEFRPELPLAIDLAMARALTRDPRRRFPTAGAFADALEESELAHTASAAPAALAAWVHTTAGAEIATREAMLGSLAELETAPTVIATATRLPETKRASRRLAAGAAVGGAVLFFVLGLGGITIGRRGWGTPGAEPTGLATALPSSAPTASSPAAIALEPLPAVSPPSASASTSAEPSSVITATRTRPSPRPRRPASCEPPFTVDADGVRHFKPECVQ